MHMLINIHMFFYSIILCLADFATVKAKYAEILSCFPENHEGTINCLQNCLSDADICEVLSLTSGHNQRLLNLLILRLKNKEDLLDFCDSLEKIDGTPSSLKTIAEQLRKGTHTHTQLYSIHA